MWGKDRMVREKCAAREDTLVGVLSECMRKYCEKKKTEPIS
jgi:hypothetical protein